MKLKDIMQTDPKTVTPRDTLVKARDLMVSGKLRHLLVVDDDQALVGVLTQRDIANHQARLGESIASNLTDTVSMAMEPNVQTAKPDDEVTHAAERMASSKIGCLPISESGRPVGLVTTTDVLAVCAQSNRDSRRS